MSRLPPLCHRSVLGNESAMTNSRWTGELDGSGGRKQMAKQMAKVSVLYKRRMSQVLILLKVSSLSMCLDCSCVVVVGQKSVVLAALTVSTVAVASTGGTSSFGSCTHCWSIQECLAYVVCESTRDISTCKLSGIFRQCTH